MADNCQEVVSSHVSNMVASLSNFDSNQVGVLFILLFSFNCLLVWMIKYNPAVTSGPLTLSKAVITVKENENEDEEMFKEIRVDKPVSGIEMHFANIYLLRVA